MKTQAPTETTTDPIDYSKPYCPPSELAAAARLKTLLLIERAQSLLYEAAQTACPLHGWCDQWEAIGDHADATKALWHKINNAPRPTGHDA